MCNRLLLVVILCFGATASAGTLEETLKGKQLFGVGVCGFKGQEFKAFAGEVLLAPKSAIDSFKSCAMFVRDRTMNPAWLVLLNDKGEPEEIIEWQDPAKFERVWIKGVDI